MTTPHGTTRQYGGCYLMFDRGKVRLRTSIENENIPETWLRSQYSIVSPGTELWHLSQTSIFGEVRPAGYMTVGRSESGEFLLAPAPHGATFAKSSNGILKAGVDFELMAVARFQLIMAIAILRNRTIFQDRAEIVVVGSGPVAMGAVLELLRLSFSKIVVVTFRSNFVKNLFKAFPAVVVQSPDRVTFGKYAIECTGRFERITNCISRLEEEGILGLLGSPRSVFKLDLYKIHRKGIRLVGLHELVAFNPVERQHLYQEILVWLKKIEIVKSKTWFCYWPSRSFGELYRALETKSAQKPLQILDWRERD